jgi:hypothetical protein
MIRRVRKGNHTGGSGAGGWVNQAYHRPLNPSSSCGRPDQEPHPWMSAIARSTRRQQQCATR